MKKEDLRLAWLVARRELVDQMRDWRILMPMLILILFFPYLMNYAAFEVVGFIGDYGQFDRITERVVPFFLMVVGFFPVTVSLVVALEAFVGEKERGTIEPMLSSPLADWHMYAGKLLAGSLVPLGASYISMGLYLVGLVLQKLPFPPLDVLVQMLLLTAVQAVLMVSAAIVISTQATSVRAANLLASFIVIPVGLLIQAESALIFWGTNEVLWLAILGVMVITVLLIRLGLAHFQREALIGREIDMLNLRWMVVSFWQAFSGSGKAPLSLRWLFSRQVRQENPVGMALGQDLRGIAAWYRDEVFPLIGRMRTAITITTLLGVLAIGVSYFYVTANFGDIVRGPEEIETISAQIRSLLLDQQEGGEGAGSAVKLEISTSWLFFNNLRAELMIFLIGLISFGVGGILVYGLNFALIGAVLGAIQVVGLPTFEIMALGVLPHGIFELPSVMLVSAGVLYLGVRLVTPNAKESIGQVFIESMAEWMKIAIGLAFPLLLVAAIIEANLTPLLLYSFLQDFMLAGG